MFCYHCQEAKKNKACDTTGICGKKAPLSSLHDLLVYVLKGLSFYAVKAREQGIVQPRLDQFTAQALYATVTNVNFDNAEFVRLISEAVQRRNALCKELLAVYQQQDSTFEENPPEEALWQYEAIDEAAFIKLGETLTVPSLEGDNKDYHCLRETLIYGVKGLAALIEHSLVLGYEDKAFYDFIHQALDFSLTEHSLEEALAMNLRCGELGLKAMALLNKANTEIFGHPVPTKIHTDVWDKPAILVSGHDLQDIEELLEQTAGTGIDVYTHGEAVVAHAYPKFKKFFNLVGNYGGAWQDQKNQFAKFNGALLVTTNSLQQAKKTYLEKLFTTGMVGWDAIPHIADRKSKQPKNFAALIEQAKQNPPPTLLTENTITTGYGLQSLLALKDEIASAIQAGAIKRLIVIAGCDGRHKERRYYTQLAESLPEDCVILTCGETKYRFNNLELGEINGIPRLLDAGQSNDFYALITFLQALQKTLGAANLNAMPVSFNIAWYEQKTIVMFLALLDLGVKNVRLGPTLPPFFDEDILTMLTEKYALKGIDTVEADIEAMLAGE
ncbi:MAG: hydroxylamine reductase [Methylococcaceae bacterium]|nr:hydroxylamine reductase [Methylococcaceae bacterium]